jgi:hypothetical protein
MALFDFESSDLSWWAGRVCLEFRNCELKKTLWGTYTTGFVVYRIIFLFDGRLLFFDEERQTSPSSSGVLIFSFGSSEGVEGGEDKEMRSINFGPGAWGQVFVSPRTDEKDIVKALDEKCCAMNGAVIFMDVVVNIPFAGVDADDYVGWLTIDFMGRYSIRKNPESESYTGPLSMLAFQW